MEKENRALNAYMKEIGDNKLLSDKEEAELAQRIQEGDSKAMDKLLKANLTFVVSLANQYKNRGLYIEDLISEGNIGMLKAAGKFRPEGHKRFVTFAAPYIREAIEKAIEQQANLYRVPRDVNDVALEKKRSHVLSIDAPVGGSPELSLGRVIPNHDSPDPDQVLQKDNIENELEQAVRMLAPREQQVVQYFYGIGVETHTMAEIGQEMGLKRERVRQIRDKAVRRLLRMPGNAHLKDYLKG
jgi:RNA polymerase primary sigma factor